MSTHVAFPEDFKRAVRALLLCHSHLEARGGRGLNYAPFNEASASATAPSPRSHGIQLSTRLLHRVCFSLSLGISLSLSRRQGALEVE